MCISRINMASGVFSGVEPAPPIEVFQNTAAFNKDDYPYKVNLSVGGKKSSPIIFVFAQDKYEIRETLCHLNVLVYNKITPRYMLYTVIMN